MPGEVEETIVGTLHSMKPPWQSSTRQAATLAGFDHAVLLRLFLIALATAGWVSLRPGVCAAPYFPRPDAEGGWRTATNGIALRRRAGLDLVRLDQAWEYTQRCSQNAGLLVVRHGWLAAERYAGRAGRDVNPDMASTGKAYTSIACGILLQEHPVRFPAGLATRVFTPEFLPEAFGPAGQLDDPRRAEITLGHLLCMSGGYTGEGGAPQAVVLGRSFPLQPVPGQDLRDLDGSSLRCAMWTNAGAGYSYSSPEPHIASMVLRRVSGMDLREYIDRKLAQPVVVQSLDLVIYKMGGSHAQYDPNFTRIPQPEPSRARDDWKPLARTPFQEASNAGDDGIRRVLEMVCAATVN